MVVLAVVATVLLGQLDATADRLWKQSKVEGSDCMALDGLPGWVVAEETPFASSQPMLPTASEQASLRQVMADAKAPAVRRALASLWLAAVVGKDELVALDRQLDDARIAVPLPSIHHGQRVGSCSLSWSETYRVSDVAMLVLRRVLGQEFADAATFRQWWKKNPDPFATFGYWNKQLDATTEKRAVLQRLEQQPEILARLATLRLDAHELSPAQLRLVQSKMSAERALNILEGAERWDEFAAYPLWENFCPRAFGKLGIFKTSDGPAVFRLWQRTPDEFCLSRAAAELNPQQLPVIAKKSAGRDRWLVTEMTRLHVESEWKTLRTWFFDKDQRRRDMLQAAILEGLSRVKPPPIDRVKELVTDARFRKAAKAHEGLEPGVLSALIDFAAVANPKLALPAKDALYAPAPRRFKGGKAPVASPEDAAATEEKARKSRRSVWTRFHKWIAKETQ